MRPSLALCSFAAALLAVALLPVSLPAQSDKQQPAPAAKPAPAKKDSKDSKDSKETKETNNEQQDLQKAIDEAGNDRAALVRNLEAFLKTYPDSPQRPQIYRALVESSLQLRDYSRATDFAERLVALRPDDIAMNVLAIQLIEKYGDAAGWRRALSYCSRVLDEVERTSISDKSPRVSTEDWEAEKKGDKASLLLVRGRLYQKLGDLANAQKDYQASFALQPSAAVAEKLGELAELRKDPNTAIHEYAIAFALSDGTKGASSRRELRNKIGNVWRLAHGSEDGLGDYLLRSFDEASAAAAPSKVGRNAGIKDVYGFSLRRVADAAPYLMADNKGKVVVLNFWATWCGPCREMEPHFEKIAARFSAQKDIVFLAINCDDDESLVAPYVEEEKPKTTVLFADNLDRLFSVNSFPTTIILDREGRVFYRGDGIDPDTIDKELTGAVEHALNSPAPPETSAAPSSSASAPLAPAPKP